MLTELPITQAAQHHIMKSPPKLQFLQGVKQPKVDLLFPSAFFCFLGALTLVSPHGD